MERVYSTRINWENEPSINTPLNALNLNKIDYAVYNLDERVVNFDTTKANQSDMLSTLKNVSYNSESGIFTFEKWNGTTITADINIEKIPVSFALSNEGILKMTTTDGTEYTANIANLIKSYTFTDTSTIDFSDIVDSNGNHTIKAEIVAGSVTSDKLQPDYLADVTAQATSASASAQSALASAQSASASAQQAMSATPAGYENLVALVGNSTLETTAQTITSAINELKNAEVEIDFDQTPTNGSQNAVTSNGIYNAIKTSADELKVHLATQNTFDLTTAEGGILIDKIKGNTVKNDDGLFTSGSLGLLDMGELDWIYNSTYKNFKATIADRKQSDTIKIISQKYGNAIYVGGASDATKDKTLYYYYNETATQYNTIIYICDFDYNTVDSLKQALKGVYLAYEVAEGKTPLKYALAIQTNNGKATTSADYKAKEVFMSLKYPLAKVNDVANYIDSTGKHYKLGCIDLGTISVDRFTESNGICFESSSIVNTVKKPTSGGTLSNILCIAYETKTRNQQWSHTVDKVIAINGDGKIYVNDDSLKSASAFTTANRGVMLYYELATEVVEPLDESIYQLESYDGKTIIDTADKYAKAEFSLRYGKSDTVAIALNAQNIAKKNEITLNGLIETMYALNLESEV